MVATIEKLQTTNELKVYELQELRNCELFCLVEDLHTGYVLMCRDLDIYTVNKIVFKMPEAKDNLYYGCIRPLPCRLRHDVKVYKFGDVIRFTECRVI